jgi:indolepyruvate ferredoxin oxidoreductase alpha subunit
MNERVAYELAYGASLAGRRAVVTMKNVGLNACADAFLHSVINGVEAGLVLVLVDDVDALSSPERQDSRPYFELFGGLWFEPNSVQMAYDLARNSFEWSEKFDVPVVIRITNQFFDLKGEYSKQGPSSQFIARESWPRDKYISYWKKRDDQLSLKKAQIAEFVETLYQDVSSLLQEDKIRIVVGSCLRELSIKNDPDYPNFKVFTYPLPEKKLSAFLKNKQKIEVFEQGSGFVSLRVKSLVAGGELVVNTGNPPDLAGSWPVWNTLEKLFKALASISPSFVVGDEGQYTDESTKTIQACLCMGASVGVTGGLSLNGVEFPFCIVGDASFLHSGIQSLTEVVARKCKMGIVVLDNGGAMSTGGQKIIGDIHQISSEIPVLNLDYSKCSEEEFRQSLVEMRNANQLSILYVKY